MIRLVLFSRFLLAFFKNVNKRDASTSLRLLFFMCYACWKLIEKALVLMDSMNMHPVRRSHSTDTKIAKI